jgi:hypothetical protein
MRQEGTTQDLLNRIAAYQQRGKFQTITDELVARYLFDYFREGLLSGHIGKYDGGTMIGHYLPLYLQDAFDHLRNGQERRIVTYRKEYESITANEVPNLVAVGGNNARRSLAVQSLGYLLCEIYGEDRGFWVRTELEKYCYAQDEVLNQKVHAFVVVVYRKNLADMLDKAETTAFSGTFGKTTLRSLGTAGRLMFTFARPNTDSLWSSNEDQISIVGEDGEKEGVRFGVQSVYCDFTTACALIDDVVKHWPADLKTLQKTYLPDRKLAIA